ncbi:MAG: galactokinase [Clostridiales bacterium]|nr:galactokinase [Clostridiales bacterium]
MSTAAALTERIRGGAFDPLFTRLYGAGSIPRQRERYTDAIAAFIELFGPSEDLFLFSAPGRTEIGGNHTDHNHGRVLAASVNLDVIAVVSPSADRRIRIQSKGYPMDVIECDDLSIHEQETNHAASLIRGIAARFAADGRRIGGFDAYTTSDVLKGSGLSSSAAFEVLTGTILNHLYNDGKIDAVEIAKISQYAENVYFGKPSGLMDQMASSVGGVITIDFQDVEKPLIRSVATDFDRSGYRLCIVDTGGNHADLTCEYASVPEEMKAVARSFGADTLRGLTVDQILGQIGALREAHGDRAVLRALHFLNENERVERQVEALEAGDFDRFKQLIIESGHSSFEYLQNVYTVSDVRFQGLSLALCVAQMLLRDCGAWRVHGGGFGGTTQNFVPEDKLDGFCDSMERVFGKSSCHILTIRPWGGISIDKMLTEIG